MTEAIRWVCPKHGFIFQGARPYVRGCPKCFADWQRKEFPLWPERLDDSETIAFTGEELKAMQTRPCDWCGKGTSSYAMFSLNYLKKKTLCASCMHRIAEWREGAERE